MFLGLVCTISALLFKLGAAPYHMWIADVYERAPTIVSLIFAVVPKIAVFIVILRLSFLSFCFFFPLFWEDFFCLCGLLSLFIGCLCGLGKTKIKRLLAFSSVGHVGFLCIGLASGSMCVCVFSSHPFWTSSSLDVPAGVTQEEGHTGFLIHLPSAVRALIFVARRIQPFLSLVDREVEFCVLTN